MRSGLSGRTMGPITRLFGAILLALAAAFLAVTAPALADAVTGSITPPSGRKIRVCPVSAICMFNPGESWIIASSALNTFAV